MKENETMLNPVSVYWQHVKVMEETWSEIWEQVLADPAYAQALGSFMTVYLYNQRQIKSQYKKLLDELNLPTKQDLAGLAKQVSGLEGKLVELQRSLDFLNSKI